MHKPKMYKTFNIGTECFLKFRLIPFHVILITNEKDIHGMFMIGKAAL